MAPTTSAPLDLDEMATSLVRAVAAEAGGDPEQARAVLDLAARLGRHAGRLDQAEAACAGVLAALEGHPLPDRALLAALLRALGALAHARGRPAAGIAWAERGLALQRSALGPDHPEVALDLTGLAALYHQAGRAADAEAAACQAVEILHGALGPAHPDVTLAASSLAAVRSDG